MSKIEEAIAPIKATILSGTLLAVDPSSGSKESMPGYSIFKAGQFVDSGVIRLQHRQSLAGRLYDLRESLQGDFKDLNPDVLIIENIPPFIASKNGFPNKSILSLHKAVGVTVSCFNCPIVEVAPISWRKYIPDGYLKTDESDSIMMALTVLKIASGFTEFPITEELLVKLKTGKWKQ
jgi:Holliday junction resolvasome RuvABC endonuclease subunit